MPLYLQDCILSIRCTLADGTKAGVQAEGKIRAVSQMSLDEAQRILDVRPSATLAEIQKARIFTSQCLIISP